MTNILITGANGQVGKALQYLVEAEWANNNTLTCYFADRATLDISNKADIHAFCQNKKIDIIINCAAYTAVDKAESESEQAYAINSDGPKNLAQVAEELGAALLHISTDYVFSGDKKDEYLELDETAPQGVYGASKLAGEQAVAQYCTRHIILRTAWVFGEYGNNFVKTMLRLAQTHNELGVVADQYGAPTYAGDIARALLTIAQRIAEVKAVTWGIYHYAGYPHVNWHQFAQAIFKQASEAGVIAPSPTVNALTTSQYPTPAKRPANSKLNCDKITVTMGIPPSDWVAALENIQAYTQVQCSHC